MKIKALTLIRVYSDKDRTFGVLIEHGKGPFAVTLEDPWKGNTREVSCIPAGNYRCQRVISPKFGDTFEVTNVPGRSHILFHKGNTEADTHGCILVAEEFGILRDTAILRSRAGYEEFMDKLRYTDTFILKIREALV